MSIARDLEKHERCKVDDMLTHFLTRCLVDPHTSSNDTRPNVLQSCLDDVLPICNSEETKQKLMKYCTSKPEEKSRYGLFVDLSNDVLKKLRTIDITDIRCANEDINILFYQNNRASIETDRGPQVSRGPAVVLVSLAAAQMVAPDRGDMQWDDIVAGYACEGPSPRKNLAWSSICASIEFEVCAYILNPPPATYSGLGQVIPAKVACLEPTTSHSPITSTKLSPAKSIHSGRRPTPTVRTAGAPFKQTKIVAKRPETLSPPIIQCGLYGVEMLSRKPCINHAINLLLIDDVIWIWWYDRQGAIQTEGINFVQDLPRFLILLFAFQRFGLEDWGFNNSLDTGFDAIHPSDVASRGIAVDQTRYIKTSILRASGEWEDIDIDTSRQVHQAYGLVGRGTSVFCGTAARLRKVESSSKRHMAGGVTTASKPSTELREVTAKIHWQEEPRLNEAEGLREAYTLRSNTDTLGHHPEPLYARDYTQYSTGHIRKKLGLDRPEKRRPARFIRLAVFLRPRPITTVVGEAFLKAWLDCVRGHYSLWELGIQDVTPGLSNLVVDMDKRGFLINWELATIFGQSSHDGRSCPEIWPIMALGLLNGEYWYGNIKRRYHHDLESFLWILPFVCLQYENGNLIKNPPLESWARGVVHDCRKTKSKFLELILSSPNLIPWVTRSWEWLVIRAFAQRILDFWRMRSPATLQDEIYVVDKEQADSETTVLTPRDIYADFWAKIKAAAEYEGGHLLYLKECVPDGF